MSQRVTNRDQIFPRTGNERTRPPTYLTGQADQPGRGRRGSPEEVSVIRSSSPTVASGRSRRLGRRRSDGPGAATAAALNAQQALRGASRDGVLRAAGERYSGLTLLLVAVDVASASLVSIFLLALPFWWEFAVAIFM